MRPIRFETGTTGANVIPAGGDDSHRREGIAYKIERGLPSPLRGGVGVGVVRLGEAGGEQALTPSPVWGRGRGEGRTLQGEALRPHLLTLACALFGEGLPSPLPLPHTGEGCCSGLALRA